MITLAYGLPGTGKSTLLHDLVGAQCEASLFLCNDHERGWGFDGVHWRGRPPRALSMVLGDEALAKLMRLPLDERPDTGVLVFRNVEAEGILELAKRWGDVTYVDDELDKAGRKQGFDESVIRAVVNEGRHLPNAEDVPSEVHLLGACRRPQKLHNDLTDLADEVYLFRCMGGATLDRVRKDGLIEEGEDDELRALPNFAFIHWPSRRRLQIAELQVPRESFQP